MLWHPAIPVSPFSRHLGRWHMPPCDTVVNVLTVTSATTVLRALTTEHAQPVRLSNKLSLARHGVAPQSWECRKYRSDKLPIIWGWRLPVSTKSLLVSSVPRRSRSVGMIPSILSWYEDPSALVASYMNRLICHMSLTHSRFWCYHSPTKISIQA